ncbi:hypothetical protein FGO68_gene1794 [Halteria grandinella]|uniref:Uncharacterized protein n=1 Tax=Halteria grandinella TaxID=5974 RepID=A0A8J8NRI1_HALGN|nr:hypothetical protein FGO68_gene1794 [Halteria grandinella]
MYHSVQQANHPPHSSLPRNKSIVRTQNHSLMISEEGESYDFYGCRKSPERFKESIKIQKSLCTVNETLSTLGKQDRATNRVLMNVFLRQNQKVIEDTPKSIRATRRESLISQLPPIRLSEIIHKTGAKQDSAQQSPVGASYSRLEQQSTQSSEANKTGGSSNSEVEVQKFFPPSSKNPFKNEPAIESSLQSEDFSKKHQYLSSRIDKYIQCFKEQEKRRAESVARMLANPQQSVHDLIKQHIHARSDSVCEGIPARVLNKDPSFAAVSRDQVYQSYLRHKQSVPEPGHYNPKFDLVYKTPPSIDFSTIATKKYSNGRLSSCMISQRDMNVCKEDESSIVIINSDTPSQHRFQSISNPLREDKPQSQPQVSTEQFSETPLQRIILPKGYDMKISVPKIKISKKKNTMKNMALNTDLVPVKVQNLSLI